MTHAAQDSVALRTQAEQIADHFVPLPHTGRPNTLTDPEKVQRFLAYLTDGNYRDTACRASGLSTSTLHRLLKLAETGDQAAIEFRDAVERAEADAESETVRNVRNASKFPQFWAAGMTYLERKSPEKWGRRTDESAAPKVIVQVGGHASDVKVLIASRTSPEHLDEAPFACSTQADSLCISGLTEHVASEKVGYVNQREAVPDAQDGAGHVAPEPGGGAGFAGAGPVVPGAPRRAGSSAVKASPAELEARRTRRRELQRTRRAAEQAARARVEEKRAKREAKRLARMEG